MPSTAHVDPLTKSVSPKARHVAWRERLASVLAPEAFEQLASRIRPELGATPTDPIARNVIFVGPPGTGKTWTAEEVAFALTGERPSSDGLVRMVQFHASYGYEDFVWGIRPTLSGDKARFREWKGPFYTVCKDALEDPDQLFVFLIDEINRGDPARIFGELLYALEYRGREITLASGGTLIIPANLVVLGTMNSVDRSVAMVDYALRRRFAFLRLAPEPRLISEKHGTPVSFAAAEALGQLNRAICELGDPELQLGHSYFLAPGRALASEADLVAIWTVDLAPQLAELFHGRGAVVRNLEKVWRDAVRRSLAELEEEDAENDGSGGDARA